MKKFEVKKNSNDIVDYIINVNEEFAKSVAKRKDDIIIDRLSDIGIDIDI